MVSILAVSCVCACIVRRRVVAKADLKEDATELVLKWKPTATPGAFVVEPLYRDGADGQLVPLAFKTDVAQADTWAVGAPAPPSSAASSASSEQSSAPDLYLLPGLLAHSAPADRSDAFATFWNFRCQ